PGIYPLSLHDALPIYGLADAQIPLEARILTVADGYDAMTSKRPYRLPMPPHTALHVLADESGLRIDPEVYRQLRTVLRATPDARSEEHTSELQSRENL